MAFCAATSIVLAHWNPSHLFTASACIVLLAVGMHEAKKEKGDIE